jgi:hypothetical protein
VGDQERVRQHMFKPMVCACCPSYRWGHSYETQLVRIIYCIHLLHCFNATNATAFVALQLQDA